MSSVTSLALSAGTPGGDRRGRRDRSLAIAFASALHLAILALFLGSHPSPTTGEGVGAGAMDVSLAGFSRGAQPSPTRAAPARSAPPARPAPPAATDPIKPRTVLQIVSDILAIPLPEHSVTPQPLTNAATPEVVQIAAAASGSPGAACDIGGAVQKALQADPVTHPAVLLIPRQQRSAANAVVIWNGTWVDPAEVGGAGAFAAIRTGIRQVVAAAQADCREREIVGPRFMIVPEAETTMVIVVGNAAWRWSDLLVDPVPSDATGMTSHP